LRKTKESGKCRSNYHHLLLTGHLGECDGVCGKSGLSVLNRSIQPSRQPWRIVDLWRGGPAPVKFMPGSSKTRLEFSCRREEAAEVRIPSSSPWPLWPKFTTVED